MKRRTKRTKRMKRTNKRKRRGGEGGGGGESVENLVRGDSFKAKAEAKPKQSKIHKTRRQAGGFCLNWKQNTSDTNWYDYDRFWYNVYMMVYIMMPSGELYTFGTFLDLSEEPPSMWAETMVHLLDSDILSCWAFNMQWDFGYQTTSAPSNLWHQAQGRRGYGDGFCWSCTNWEKQEVCVCVKSVRPWTFVAWFCIQAADMDLHDVGCIHHMLTYSILLLLPIRQFADARDQCFAEVRGRA